MTHRRIGLAALVAGVTISAACTRVPSSIAGIDRALAAATRTERQSEELERTSSTWDVTKRPLEGRQWLLATREDRLRIALLREHAAEDRFLPEAASLLERMLSQARRARLIAAEGAPPSDIPNDEETLAAAERAHLASRTQTAERLAWLDELEEALPPVEAVGGRYWRMLAGFPAVPFLYTWIAVHASTEDKGPYPHEFSHAEVFSPQPQQQPIADPAEATDAQLLAFYAPVIVQDLPDDVSYDRSADRIGHPIVHRDERGNWSTAVDTSRPTVFTHITRAYLAGEWHTQLNYTLWYPEHPPVASFDPESGHTEGVQLRLTLDLHNRPLLMETVFSCGCFHRVFPVAALEREATETYGPIEAGRSPLGRDMSFSVDPIIPQSMGTFDPADPHPRVYVYGGKHFAGAVEFGGPIPADTTTTLYRLTDAEDLEHLPSSDGIASFFAPDGLVRGADRPESTLLFPTGFYHAGTPRIRGTHLIHFDQYDYDDPQLLEGLLRLPPKAYLDDIRRSPYAHPAPGSGDSAAQSPATPGDSIPRANKKGFFCPC